MATLGELVVNLIAKTLPFESGMRKATQSLTKLQTTGDTVSQGMEVAFARMARGVAGLVVATAGIAALRNEMNRLDEAIKVADRTGLNFEQLQGLAYGADLSGMSFEELAGSLEKYSANIGKMTYGTSRAKKALDSLHLSAKEMMRLPLADQMAMLADRLNSIPEAELKVSLARDLFGDTKILTFLAEGSSGIRKLMEEAGQLGIITGRDAAEGVVKANDAITTLGVSLRTLATEIVTTIAPAINKASVVGVDMIRGAKHVAAGWFGGAKATLADFMMSSNTGLTSENARAFEDEQLEQLMRSQGLPGTVREMDDQYELRLLREQRMATVTPALRRLAAPSVSTASGLMGSGIAALQKAAGSVIDYTVSAVGSVEKVKRDLMPGLVRNAIAGGLGTVASFGQAMIGGVDVSKFSQGGGFDSGQAKIGGSRAAIEAQAQRAREHQVAIEKEQLLKLQEMAKALLDPARLTTFVVTSLGG